MIGDRAAIRSTWLAVSLKPCGGTFFSAINTGALGSVVAVEYDVAVELVAPATAGISASSAAARPNSFGNRLQAPTA
jgi:hypothetical protein